MSNILEQIKVSGVTYGLVDATAIHSLDGYWNSGQTSDAITAATAALAETIGEEMSAKTDNSVFTAYTASTEAVITGKADTTAVTEAISEAVSGKLDTSVFETYSGNVNTALASKFAGAAWNSTDKKIYFYDNSSATGTALAFIDGTDFVKDGFLSSVTIDNRTISGESVPCLVFIWNTDSGLQETDIPLSGIFDPTNYVDVATYTAYTAATNDTITGLNATLTAHTADTDIHVTTADKTEWSGKQNALTAGTGIDITNDVISVTGVPLSIDTEMSDSSTNPVQNKVIKSYVDTEVAKKNPMITVSGTTLVIS